jgi:phosphoserine phosphatase
MTTSTNQFIYIYVDVDDTLVRSVGRSRIPMASVVEHVRNLKAEGAILYCWSSGGGEYAQASAEELGIADCFVAFLPKPNVVLDDQDISQWRYLKHFYPLGCASRTLNDYHQSL